ncbi:MAG: DUF5683 domain-containing protein [Dysgonamonadaceae bacterium]|nr:DUF5683 domain-containing protein [Dysgonamonadaceae bacterium]
MKSFILLIIGSLLLIPVSLHAQEEVAVVPKDTTEAFVPNPNKAVLYSALFPGLGQIYNRKYWKLPIVYGGFLGCAYAITWNGTTYTGYKNAYHDISTNSGDSWKNYLPYYAKDNPDAWLESYRSNFTSQLKNARDFHRRNLELSVIVTVGLYALCMIDAYVDAQLFSFDISDDLSMKVDPVIFEPTPFQSRSFGFQCSLTF